MKSLDIYINEQKADIWDIEKLRLTLTFSISDINKITTRSSGRSYTVTLPASKVNKQIFGFAEDINSAEALDQNQRWNAYIISGGIVILRGFVKITDIVIADKIPSYKVVFIGDNGDWKEAMNELKWSDIDLSAYDHEYSKFNINESEKIDSSGGILTDKAIVYPLINFGNFFGDGSYNQAIVEDRVPSIQIYKLIYEFYKAQGYKISSAFLQSDFFQRLYLPIINTFKHSDSWVKDKLFRGVVGGTDKYLGGFTYSEIFEYKQIKWFNVSAYGGFDNGGNFHSSFNCYYPSEAVRVKFITELKIKLDDSVNPETIFKVYVKFTDNTNGATIGYASLDDITANNEFQTYNLESNFVFAKQYAEIGVWIYLYPTSYFGTWVHVWIGVDSIFYNDVLPDYVEGNNIETNDILPDLTQLELIQGVKELFNLYFYTDIEAREVTIEPRDDFYLPKEQAENWTKKLDPKEKQEITYIGNIKKEYKYQYEKDSNDKFVEKVEKLLTDPLASQNTESKNKFVTGEQITGTKLFAPTIMATDPYNLGFKNEASQIPKLWDNDTLPPQPAREFELRILYYAGIKNLPTGEYWHFGIVNTANKRYDYPYFYSVNEFEDNDNSLYYNDTYRSSGLFEKFFRNLHKTLDDSRIYKAFIYLNDSDISNLNFRKYKIINKTYYILNKIANFNTLSVKSTAVELLKVVSTRAKAVVEGEGLAIQIPVAPVIDEPEPEPDPIRMDKDGISEIIMYEDEDGTAKEVKAIK